MDASLEGMCPVPCKAGGDDLRISSSPCLHALSLFPSHQTNHLALSMWAMGKLDRWPDWLLTLIPAGAQRFSICPRMAAPGWYFSWHLWLSWLCTITPGPCPVLNHPGPQTRSPRVELCANQSGAPVQGGCIPQGGERPTWPLTFAMLLWRHP